MSDKEKIQQMQAALRNIRDISSDEFSRQQARWGLGEIEHLRERGWRG